MDNLKERFCLPSSPQQVNGAYAKLADALSKHDVEARCLYIALEKLEESYHWYVKAIHYGLSDDTE